MSSEQRQNAIAESVQHGLLKAGEKQTWGGWIGGYFSINCLDFEPVEAEEFRKLREAWGIKEDDYRASFEGSDALKAMGDMGYSGSTFFHTADGGYLVKSIPRHFEHSFFKDDLLHPYSRYMQGEPGSLLVRITDFLECSQHSLGSLIGSAPSHHIIMENIMYGQDKAKEAGDEQKWQHWDLKPMSYFYPERDVAGGALSSEATKSKLADEFDEQIVLSIDQEAEFRTQLEKDTKLLADCNAVDYSLFLVRIPLAKKHDIAEQPSDTQGGSLPPNEPPFVPPSPPSWRTGITSADGQYAYRAAVLDFFWAKHTVHAKAMTGLINAYNAIDRQGPMSVTTDAPEYRQRFLNMCKEIVEIRAED